MTRGDGHMTRTGSEITCKAEAAHRMPIAAYRDRRDSLLLSSLRINPTTARASPRRRAPLTTSSLLVRPKQLPLVPLLLWEADPVLDLLPTTPRVARAASHPPRTPRWVVERTAGIPAMYRDTTFMAVRMEWAAAREQANTATRTRLPRRDKGRTMPWGRRTATKPRAAPAQRAVSGRDTLCE